MGIKGKRNLETNIRDLPIGKTYYTVPWALAFNKNDEAFLDLGMSVTENPRGTSSMPIKRIGPGRADYDVNVDFDYGGEKYKWSLQENPFSGVVGTSISEIVKLDYNSGNRTNVQKNVGLGKNYSIDDMRNDLSNALKMENYEEAAKLRDKINKIQSKSKE